MSSPKLSRDEQVASLKRLHDSISGNNKIGCIKEIRNLKRGLGLAESKFLIERCVESAGGWDKTDAIYEKVKYELRDVLFTTFTKEQFMGLVSAAYDTHEDIFCDPLEAVLHALNNLKSKGGLEYAAAKADAFIDKI
jgi:hypothetical protein